VRSPSRWFNPPPALPFPLPQIMDHGEDYIYVLILHEFVGLSIGFFEGMSRQREKEGGKMFFV
jgi:hypothetical protein